MADRARGRQPQPADTPKHQWAGQYALPVPGEISAIASTDEQLPISLTTWQYGDVAEVLHVGPYSSEEADIKRLLDFARSKGYRVVGDHEEEYVRGPGMIFAGDPDRYLTIIRVRVEKAS
jgi:effector-binding domain-containing protein